MGIQIALAKDIHNIAIVTDTDVDLIDAIVE